ncbi:outer membrane protein assembly factor BamB [Marinobacter sp. X15-166B]|uniref:outer membrane protein assembly factor BamB n=1 Tax=Marinobacter sp. X15-166B TaxID=1897620 RepID=UPI00085C38A6|nr:outer membrane protein assembly factor BamB [Marinobacter sp. X15-166B]OEY67381.1 outer membrane protein assembly factor BamB [Marinobacter sp. X15-166B]
MRCHRWPLSRYPFLAGLLVWLLAGCSATDTFEQPAPVPEVVSTVLLKKVWATSVADGHDDRLLQLAPWVADDTIYAVSSRGVLFALNAADGTRKWREQLETRILSGVSGDQARLYLVSENARLMALSRDAGERLWEAALPNESIVAPQSNGSIVVAQTIDGKVLGFDAQTGEKRWQYDGVVPVLTLRAAAPPLVGRELTLASFANGRLLALSTETGQPLWQYRIGEPKGRTELERLVDVTSQPLILEGAALVTGYQGKLALVDLRGGREIWSRPSSSLHTPMIGQGHIFVSEANGDIVAYDGRSREKVWTQDKLAWRQTTQPLVVDDHLLVGDFEGFVHVLSLTDGSLQGQLKYDSDGLRVPMQPLHDGVLVYGNSGKLTLFKLETRS